MIALIKRSVFRVVDGIIRLLAGLPRVGIFPRHHRLFLRAKGEMLMLDYTRIGHLQPGIVDHRVALIILRIQHLRLKAQAAIGQMPQRKAVKRIDEAGINRLFRQRVQRLTLLQIIDAKAHLHPLEHARNHGAVSILRDALIAVGKVVVVVRKAHRQAADDKRRQLRTGTSPLLLRIAAHERFVHVAPHK